MPFDPSEPPPAGRLQPPGLGLLLAEVRGIFEFNASLLLSPLLMRAPKGDGHPVLTLPGFEGRAIYFNVYFHVRS